MRWPRKDLNQNPRSDRRNDFDRTVKGQSKTKKEVRCWRCNQTGHFQAQCKASIEDKAENQKKEELENSNVPN